MTLRRLLLLALAILLPLSLLGGKTSPGPQEPSEPHGSESPGISRLHDSPGDEGKGGEILTDPAALAALLELEGPASCREGTAARMFPCSGVGLQSFLPLETLRTGAASASNLWGFADLDDGREYAVIGLNNGTSVVDVSDPERPAVIGSVPGNLSFWREVKVFQFYNAAQRRHNAYAYVVSEAPGSGLQIVNLSELPREISLAATDRGFDTAHTVFLANADLSSGLSNAANVKPLLYIQGPKIAGIVALDISDPQRPLSLGSFTDSYGHDIWAGVLTGVRAAACLPGHDPCELVVNWAGDAIRFLDWTDKRNPRVISELKYSGLGYAHSGWIAADGLHLLSLDEQDERLSGENTLVRVIDVADVRTPSIVGAWRGASKAIEHNGYTREDRFYMAHYERGLTVLDLGDPRNPRERAFFDTFPASDNAAFHGAWGVYPYLPSGNILVSNIDGAGGLFLLKETADPGESPRDPIVRPPGQPRAPRSER